MIKSFRHKGLKKFFEKGSLSGIQSNHAKKLRIQLAAIDTAQIIDDVDLPGFRLHPLKGEREGVWSITVNGNWRITFEFSEGKCVYIRLRGLPLMNMHNPPHPGEFIQEVYLEPFGYSCRFLSQRLNVASSTLNRIIKGQSSISPEMALRLSKAVGRTPESWLAMQDNYDLWQARQTVNLDGIQPVQFDAA